MSGVIPKRCVAHDSMVRTWINEGDDALEAVQIAMSSHAFTILRFVWWNS